MEHAEQEEEEAEVELELFRDHVLGEVDLELGRDFFFFHYNSTFNSQLTDNLNIQNIMFFLGLRLFDFY